MVSTGEHSFVPEYGISPIKEAVCSYECDYSVCTVPWFYNIPAYLSGVKGSFTGLLVDFSPIQQTSGYQNATPVGLMDVCCYIKRC